MDSSSGYIHGELLSQHWDPRVILLSFLTTASSTFACLEVSQYIQYCESGSKWYIIFILLGGYAIGIDVVWCMHFVGMQALSLKGGELSGATETVMITFEFSLTLMGAIVAWLICSLALHVVSGRRENSNSLDRELMRRIAFSTVLLATGIMVVHYSGMISQSGMFDTKYNPAIICASGLVATAAAFVLSTVFFLSTSGFQLEILRSVSHVLPSSTKFQLLASAVIAAGTNAAHYSGMASAVYHVNLEQHIIAVPGSMVIEISAPAVGLWACACNYVIVTVCSRYGSHLRSTLIEAAGRQVAVKAKVEKGVELIKMLPCPLYIISAADLLSMTQEDLMGLHEGVRARGKLLSLDTIEDVQNFKKNHLLLFLSYEWLSWNKLGPSSDQFATIKMAMLNVCTRFRISSDSLFVWLDILSIPQRHATLKSLAIDSLYSFARSADILVIVAPTAVHEGTGQEANVDTYLDRVWTRIEQMAHCANHGLESMFIQTTDEFRNVPDDWMLRACCVFKGKMTCCRLKHPNGAPCDKESLVCPMLALYYHLYVQHLNGTPSANSKIIWELILSVGKDEMFPPYTVVTCQDGKPEVKELFGSTLGLVECMAKQDCKLMGTSLMLSESQRSERDPESSAETSTGFHLQASSSFAVAAFQSLGSPLAVPCAGQREELTRKTT